MKRIWTRDEFIFFWSHTEKSPWACLSQWYPSWFCVGTEYYNTSEQFMMAQKAALFGDEPTRAKIMATSDPRKIKTLGRQVQNFNEQEWHANRFHIVVKGNLAKFSQNEEIKRILKIHTLDKILVEASPVDDIWGIGMAKDNPAIIHPDLWRGQNLLGFALMEVRSILRQMHI